MQKRTLLSLFVTTAMCFAIGASAAEEAKLLCPVSGHEASKSHAVSYKGGKVYFCCDNCPKAFAKNKDKFAAKANAQLVATAQYKQKACPLTGKPCNKATATEIGGVNVYFCCNNCKGAIEKLEGDDAKVAKVFSNDNFKKGFVLAKKKSKKNRD